MTTSAGPSQPLARNREILSELVPVLRRAVTLDARALARLRMSGGVASVFVRLPFGVLVSRSVAHAGDPHAGDPHAGGPHTGGAEPIDVCVRAAELLDWFDGEVGGAVPSRDADWRGSLPPESGWRRIETVPDDVIRGLVRSGALALKDAAAREGMPAAQPRADVADALLDSVVLSVRQDDGPATADITLRSLSALTRMGFLRRESTAGIDIAGRWTRIAAEYGSVLAERPGLGIGLSIGHEL